MCHALYELALQAASRPIDEKCPSIGRVYDWSSRRMDPHIWLSVRLLAIPTRVLALSSAFIYNKNLWVKSDIVEQNNTPISFKNIGTHVIIHTPYSSKEPSQRFARQHASTPAYGKYVPLLLPVPNVPHLFQLLTPSRSAVVGESLVSYPFRPL